MIRLAVAGRQEAGRASWSRGSRALIVLGSALLLALAGIALPAGAAAEQASQPTSPAAGQLDAGAEHTCSLIDRAVRCWGSGTSGRLGYGNTNNIGDNETPGAAGPVDLGPGRTATAISAGDFHTCAILDDGSVRCWGFGADGRLGYANTNDIGDNETPGSAGPVNIGIGRTATAISAGSAHTCVVLNTGKVLCWGFGGDDELPGDGRLGYGDVVSIGDDEEPGTLAPVDTGPQRVTAISAGGTHTCALLEDGKVRCWGANGFFNNLSDGRLGTGDPDDRIIGDNEPPTAVEPITLGAGATAIGAGDFHSCAVLEDGKVRCWGNGLGGRLGYGNTRNIGDNETPGSAGPVDLGGTAAAAISAGNHTCARLVTGQARCWGPGASGRLGYGNTADLGDNETSLLMPVDLGGTPTAISAGKAHTCALLGAATVRCWGEGDFGRLGYGNVIDIGDDETPSAAGPVDFRPLASIGDATLAEGSSGEAAATFTVNLSSASGQTTSVAYATADEGAVAPADYTAQSGTLTFAPGETSKTITVNVKGDTLDEPNERFLVGLSAPINLVVADAQAAATILDDDAPPSPPVKPVDKDAAARRAQAARLRGLRTCLGKIKRGPQAGRARRACLKRWGRTPGPVKGLKARAVSKTKIVLTFRAAGTHGSRAPAAQKYLIKQSNRPIRGARGFRRAPSLCRGSCRLPTVTRVGAKITLTITDLTPRTSYYYSVAARDNVSGRPGPRSKVARARTR